MHAELAHSNLRPTHSYGAFDAKNRFGTLLDLAEAGETVTITRRGQPVARLVSIVDGPDVQAARRNSEALRALTQSWRLDGLKVNDLKAAGRR